MAAGNSRFAAIAADEHMLNNSNSNHLYSYIWSDEPLLPLRQQAGGRCLLCKQTISYL